MNCIRYICGLCSRRISPENDYIVCSICYETGAKKRDCCKCMFCDHCYTKNKACPNCNQATQLEGISGQTFIGEKATDINECRICLQAGSKRSCCGNYYCDECFYKLPYCRSCKTPIASSGLGKLLGGATFWSVLLGWGIVGFGILCIFAVVTVVSTSETSTPTGIYGNKCYGLFVPCDVNLCIDLDSSVADGTSPLPDLTTLKFCTLDSVAKLRSAGCVFDNQVYPITNGLIGYDICRDDFNQGTYIFEDNFENWANKSDFTTNTMKSSVWDEMENALVSTRCGNGKNGDFALSFNGPDARYASTVALNVVRGGWVEADIMMSPAGFESTHPYCKTSNQGIDLEYSIDNGANWVQIIHYDAWFYRSSNFFHVQETIPEAAKTTSTMFRFSQVDFQQERDAWAIDNVKIFHYLPSDWDSSSAFKAVVDATRKHMARIQCCFRSDWCTTRITSQQQHDCKDLEWFRGSIFGLRGIELFIIFCILLNVLKFIYVSLADYFIHKKFPFNDEFKEIIQIDKLMQYIPVKYRPNKNRYVSQVDEIHRSARTGEEWADEGAAPQQDLNDVMKRKDVLEREREMRVKNWKREKKRLIERMKVKRYDGPGLESIAHMIQEGDVEDKDKEYELDVTTQLTGSGVLVNDAEVMKRGCLALLRIPFQVKDNPQWRRNFGIVTMVIFGIIFLVQISMTSYYVLFAKVVLFGETDSKVYVSSLGINFFAFVCDLKELYYILHRVIPFKDSWIPMVTIDLSTEVNSLFVDSSIIPLTDVMEFVPFNEMFMYLCAIAYFVAAWPWCLLSLIIMNQYLSYDYMRFVSPILGLIFCGRAVLGASFIVKTVFGLYYFFDGYPVAREMVGRALRTDRAQLSAWTTSFAFSIGGLFISVIFFTKYVGIIFGCLVIFGYMYGLCTGCMHSLPIRPWMYLTTLDAGVWMRVQKKQRCPCIYWGGFCTEIHLSEEVLILFPKDEVKFKESLLGNLSGQKA